eukprot:scaffold15786_cov31-Attheya_sp.AAC.1
MAGVLLGSRECAEAGRDMWGEGFLLSKKWLVYQLCRHGTEIVTLKELLSSQTLFASCLILAQNADSIKIHSKASYNSPPTMDSLPPMPATNVTPVCCRAVDANNCKWKSVSTPTRPTTPQNEHATPSNRPYPGPRTFVPP